MTDFNKFNKAFNLHSQGKIKDAEKIYKEILEQNPDNAEVLNLLGIIKIKENLFNEAVDLIKKALSIVGLKFIFFSDLHTKII